MNEITLIGKHNNEIINTTISYESAEEFQEKVKDLLQVQTTHTAPPTVGKIEIIAEPDCEACQ